MAPWNDSEDRQLLLSVITLAQVNPNWDDVATQMGKTKEAVRCDLVNLNSDSPTNARFQSALR